MKDCSRMMPDVGCQDRKLIIAFIREPTDQAKPSKNAFFDDASALKNEVTCRSYFKNLF
jgi:hypothetical protein